MLYLKLLLLADYIHYIADLIQPDRVANDLQTEEEDANEQKTKCRCLDVGVGANCIYPIIGHTEYGWTQVLFRYIPVPNAIITD